MHQEERTAVANDVDKLLGPFYTAKDVALALGVSELEVSELTLGQHLLSLVTDSGTTVYPTFQVGPRACLLN
jgi:hypothetical protein